MRTAIYMSQFLILSLLLGFANFRLPVLTPRQAFDRLAVISSARVFLTFLVLPSQVGAFHSDRQKLILGTKGFAFRVTSVYIARLIFAICFDWIVALLLSVPVLVLLNLRHGVSGAMAFIGILYLHCVAVSCTGLFISALSDNPDVCCSSF